MKVKKWKFRFFGWFFYVSNTPFRIKYRQDRDGKQRDFYYKHKKPFLDKHNWTCEICGKKEEHLNIHHILRWANFPELRTDERNFMCLCNDCHNAIHDNPFLECKMIRKKAKELGYNVKDLYKQ